MLGRYLQKIIILALASVILLPTEEDGVFDSIFLGLNQSDRFHLSYHTKTKSIPDTVASTEITGADDSAATLARSRCDFLDLVFQNNTQNYDLRLYFYSQLLLNREAGYSYLLSYFLLNLPPPIA